MVLVPAVPSPQTTFREGVVYRLYCNMSGADWCLIFLGLNPPVVPLGPIEITGSGGGTSSQETVTDPVESIGMLRNES
jgi:hypothetical protein